MSDTKLKPCPFCGSEAEMMKAHNSQYPFVYFAICKKENCKASVGIFSNTREGAIKQWNTRKPIDRIVEQLEQQADQYKRRCDEAEQKGFSREADKYYGKQCSYLHSVEIVKAGEIDG